MKNSSGIDLSELTEAQRKMCVRLLAMNNVHFIQNNDNYVATLRVPTSELKNYIVNKKDSRSQHQNQGKTGKKLNIKQIQNSKSKQKQREKSKDKQNNLFKLPSTAKKQVNKFKAGKKPLFKSVKLALISKIELLHPEVQIYVYPKKMPLAQLQEQIQQVYDQYWLANRSGILSDFHQCYYDIVCPQKGNLIKAKNDQNLVNSLQTMNHFQHKQIGIKIFLLFLSQTYKNEQLSYFLVLRALLQELLGQKIVNQKYRSKPNLQTNLINKSNISTTGNTKPKLKWNPFDKQLSEFVCHNFLKVVVPKSNTIESTFEKLTEFMYYCEVKKGNFIRYYDLIDFMLKIFSQECQDVTTTNLELSYSNNDSTLNDIIAQSGHRSTDRPLQTKFQLSLINQSSLNVDEQPPQKEVFDNNQILTEQALNKAKQICRRLFLPIQVQNQILEKVYQCVQSIINMDKIKWVQVLGLEGSEQEINFIEQIQIGYKNLCKQGNKLVMPNNLVKRMFVGPGFIKLFSKNVSF